jgi:hypothetical protein
MATRPARSTTRRRRHRTAHLEFSAIEIVGSLLTPDIVARVAAFDAPDQTEESYGILPGLNLRDEIARYYRIGEALWSRFSQTALANPESSSKFIATLLQQCFGFETLHQQKAFNVADREFPLHHAALGIRLPVVIARCVPEGHRRAGVDEGLDRFADGHRRRSATLLVQEYLNAAPEAMWGIASDGFTLRLLRDSVSLTRPAWIEANIAKIFTEGLFPDFSALWLLIHESRFGQADAQASDCSLERWRERGRTDGVAAREHLRNGVEAALLELGAGFIEHPANQTLRMALSSGSLSGQSYYEELLRLVYRFIFLFVAEDRGLLHISKATEEARRVYADGYSLGRLRERCMRRAAWDRHTDAWEGVKAAHSALARGDERLGLPALGGLFAAGVLTNLENARLENRRLLAAVWRLAWLRPEGQPLTRVNWRDMETEEFGSVYESLLELVPRPSADRRTFQFAEDQENRGSERKKSGSYYTPDSLVKLLLDSALDPVLDAAEARNQADPAAEILKLSIIDPACGSGHFLLGAARRAAGRIAKLKSPGAPSQAEFQHALRQVVSQCIYGVDRNHMAVELCRVALWIEALESDKPLAFLDNHVRCGDSLIGVFSYEALRQGIPDEAYKQLTGDSKEAAKSYAVLNKEGREGKAATGLFAEFKAPKQLAAGAMAVFAMPEDSLDQVKAKSAAFDDLQVGVEWQQLKAACDGYVAAFFLPKMRVPSDEDLADGPVPLTEHVWAVVRGSSLKQSMSQSVEGAAGQIGAFHWPMQFPHVFAKGGFDVVIGNPPWERIKLQEQEFFAALSPDIAQAQNKAARERLIKDLENAEPNSAGWRLHAQFLIAKRTAEATSEFARNSGRFPLSGTGDVNTYALFAEHFGRLACKNGRSGIIVPTGIATDSSTSAFFGDLISSKRLAGLIDFENRDAIFPGVHRSYKFCLLTIGASDRADFSFFLPDAKQLEDSERKFSLTAEQIARINPNTKTAPVFRSRADAELTTKLYSRAPVLIEEHEPEDGGDVNPWGISFQAMFHMSGDSDVFSSQQDLDQQGWTRNGSDWIRETAEGIARRVPLYEAKMIHHFDHRWATYGGGSVDDEESARDTTLAEKQNPQFEPTPRYWVPEEEVKIRVSRIPASVKRAYRDANPDRCLKALAEWIVGFFQLVEGRDAREADLIEILGKDRSWRTVLGASIDRFLLTPKTKATGREIQFATPLCRDDLAFVKDGPDEPIALMEALIERKQPRWLMGWRDICRSTDERTVIASVFPKVGVNHKIPLLYTAESPASMAAFLGLMTSMPLDYVARQKIGSTSLTYSYLKQFAMLPPAVLSPSDPVFITPRVLELTYTSRSLKLWAEDLGHLGAPFAWDEDRRALLRAELDALFARKYGLSKDELRYILDPADVKGTNYPSETFRVLKNKEESRYGEYRTRRLVLEAWDRLGNI